MGVDMYNQSMFLVIKAAYLYYIGEKSQRDIADELSVSVTTVSRLLKKAKEEHIIEFVIRDPYVEYLELGKKIKSIFGLKEVIIASAMSYGLESDGINDSDNIKKSVALEGARYLQRIIKPEDTLGITWGSTVYNMINFLNPAQKVDATFVTLHGSLTYWVNELDVRTLVSRISKAFSGQNYSLSSDTFCASKEMADMIKKGRNASHVYEMFDRINISVVGIGSIYPTPDSILVKPEYLSAEDVKQLKEKEAVGDIALHFFDKYGRECDTSLKDRTISMDFEKYKKIPTKIAMASDPKKAYSVLSALRGKLVDVLIIDNQLGEEILRVYEDGSY